MNRDSGSPEYPIWLIGDSTPARWEKHLDDPLDSRHPARHNIWTPILEEIQSRLYASMRKRLRTGDLYIRNAVHVSSDKPSGNERKWSPEVEEEMRNMSRLFECHAPKLVFSFGAFAFEFVRRSRDETPHHVSRHWTTRRLGEQFGCRIREFTPRKVNVIPLLHASIARGRFLESHRYFTQAKDGNYFEYVAEHIADCLCRNHTEFPIW